MWGSKSGDSPIERNQGEIRRWRNPIFTSRWQNHQEIFLEELLCEKERLFHKIQSRETFPCGKLAATDVGKASLWKTRPLFPSSVTNVAPPTLAKKNFSPVNGEDSSNWYPLFLHQDATKQGKVIF